MTQFLYITASVPLSSPSHHCPSPFFHSPSLYIIVLSPPPLLHIGVLSTSFNISLSFTSVSFVCPSHHSPPLTSQSSFCIHVLTTPLHQSSLSPIYQWPQSRLCITTFPSYQFLHHSHTPVLITALLHSPTFIQQGREWDAWKVWTEDWSCSMFLVNKWVIGC